MRIAQMAPLIEPVPPSGYGGTERVVADLCDELVRPGHDVTLFASGDSSTAARLEPMNPVALRHQMTAEELGTVSPHLHLTRPRRAVRTCRRVRSGSFPHRHHGTCLWSAVGNPYGHHIPWPSRSRPPSNRARRLSRRSADLDQRSQRRPLADLPLNWVATVPNGIRVGTFPMGRGEGGYLAFLGRISPEKRPDLAVEVARRSGLPLRVGAKVDPVDIPYWEERIRPLFLENDVDFLGEVDHAGKSELLAGAAALVFPIDWPEPFGLVMVESLACGTPVVALNRGSVAEIIRQGRGGFIGETVDDLVDAVGRLGQWIVPSAGPRRSASRWSVWAPATRTPTAQC